MVSIIIPCHNSEKYLSECIDSILFQDYSNFEIILVNDFSTDNTIAIADRYAKSENRIKITGTSETESLGASVARNKGFEISIGEYIVFLDSDDIWLPTSLKRLVNLIEEHNEAGWVIGNCIYFKNYRYNLGSYEYSKYDLKEGIYDKFVLIPEFIKNFDQTPSQGAAIIKRDVVEKIHGWENEFKKNYTDQAFYTKILCETKTFVTHEFFLLYRTHEESASLMSIKSGEFKNNEKFFFEWLIRYLRKYDFAAKDDVLKYASEMIKDEGNTLSQSNSGVNLLRTWLQKIKKLPRKLRTLIRIISSIIVRVIPKKIYRRLLHQGLKPYSEEYGSDRGTEIARFYTENFLDQNKGLFEGNCLEFQEPTYLLKFSNLQKCNINVIHLDDSNPLASIVADLTKPNHIPSDYFDCIICTHVLHVVFKKSEFFAEIKRILKPGGHLFLTVPGVSMCDYSWQELWRFTELGIKKLLEQEFEKDLIRVTGFGNSLVAAGQIRGMTKEEFSLKELTYCDGRFAVEICAIAQKKQHSSVC